MVWCVVDGGLDSMTALRLHETAAAAGSWLTDTLVDIEQAVGRVVPATYDAYARILIPLADGRGGFTRWRDASPGGVASLVQWDDLAPVVDSERGAPPSGTIDEATAIVLAQVLRGFTSTPDDCFFAFWEGYAGLPPRTEQSLCVVPPDRRMAIYAGPIEAAAVPLGLPYPFRRPVRWWPSDRRWCVGADIYSRSLLVGGATACIDALALSPLLEVELIQNPLELRSL